MGFMLLLTFGKEFHGEMGKEYKLGWITFPVRNIQQLIGCSENFVQMMAHRGQLLWCSTDLK
jgi:hypothetical protein